MTTPTSASGPTPGGTQVPRQCAGAFLELAVRRALAVRGDRDCSGLARRCGRDEVMDAGLWNRYGGVVPGGEELAPFALRKDGELGEPAGGIGRRGAEEAREVPEPAPDRGTLEQLRLVLQIAGEAAGDLADREGEVEPRDTRMYVDRPQGDVTRRDAVERQVLQDEEDLEEGRVAEAALGAQPLDQLLEGHLLVGEGAERGLADALDEGAERRVTREIMA